ncbi:peptidoglycan recognition protein family protein [Nocardioides daeguensis]|uniref:N-acetylmuramoyl-L-alanine amidase n=1 Tax=Nocardioides daeguensis TaxID=908359 RepID=A0ABP6VW43_9ACTN|nr:peptidoglycan recognition protein [Nocardioides daeguensis]MBV6728379.1 peptidoglycan recognition protein [Nocardioides daeguensis]MCR1773803.1 peptidoglycan recognition protein [Nocardioides daeguensis]
MSLSDPYLRRRDLASLGAAVAVLPLVAITSGPAAAVPAGADGRLRLRPDEGGPGRALDVALTPDPQVAARGATLRTAEQRTDRFALLGVTWAAGAGQVRVRVRGVRGTWGPWRDVPPLRDLPDRGTGEARRTRGGTEPLWVGDSDGVQVEVTGVVERPVLTLVDPGDHPGDAAADRSADDLAERPGHRSLRPRIRSRRAWHANPRLATGRPKRVKSVEQVHVHHTATGNDYRRREVPRILRAIYRYHTKTLGWSDVGYNFFVDRFGRIWAGRRGADSGRDTRGAHTLGFNHTSVGIAVLGSYQEVAPAPEVLSAVAKIAAWKLKSYHRDPLATTLVLSHGSDLYPKGTWVTLPVIDGHRDTNDTECPGQLLYDALPGIRLRTARRIEKSRR